MPKQADMFSDLENTPTFTVGDQTFTTDDTIMVGDDAFDITGDDVFTIAGLDNWITDYSAAPSIKIGKYEITEDTAEKLHAVLDVIENLEHNNEFKALFNTQLSMNRIRGEDEDQSD